MGLKVSVIVPVYNVGEYITECVESVITQTLDEIEIILIDDGSKDNSGALLDQFASRDVRVKVIHKENAGVSAARNDGIAISTGDYIYIMDSDDYLEKDALEIMYNNAIETGSDVVITDHYTFKEDNIQKSHHFFAKEFVTSDQAIIQQIQNMTLHLGYSPYFTTENTGMGIAAPWTKLVKRELIFENDIKFDPYVQGIFDDGLFTLAVFQFAKKVSYIQKYTYHYRILESSLIHRFNANRVAIDKKVFQRIEEFSKEYEKNNDFNEAMYARIILYMVHSFGVYFFHKNYTGTAKENYIELRSMMTSEPYKTAIQNVDITKLKRVQRYVTILARLHMIPCIWIAFRLRMKLKK